MSCLFKSIGFHINEKPENVRKQICVYLEENKSLFDDLDTAELLNSESNSYVENMNDSNTWGGAIEIKVACNIWNVRINVHHKLSENIPKIKKNKKNKFKKMNNIDFLPKSSDTLKIEFIPNGSAKQTINIYYNGYHYEPYKFF